MVDNHLLSSFLALIDQGSVTRAAEALGLQQPTVSLHLKALRQQFGDPLFVRQSGRMLPTPRALDLVKPCRAILEQLAYLTDPGPVFDPASSTHIFRIAMTDASQVTLLPHILVHLAKEAPAITLSVSLLDDDLAQKLTRGDVDLALGYIPWLEGGCRRQALYDQSWVCLARREIGQIDRRAYEDASHVRIASGTGAQLLEDALMAENIQRRVRLELPGFLGLAAIVGEQDYVATVPQHTAAVLSRLNSNLGVQSLPFPAPGFRVCQYWSERFDRSPALVWLRTQCHHLLKIASTEL